MSPTASRRSSTSSRRSTRPSRSCEGFARLFIMLKPDRARTSIEFERQLTPELAQIPDARVTFQSQNGGGGTGRDISVICSSGGDPQQLWTRRTSLVEQMKAVP